MILLLGGGGDDDDDEWNRGAAWDGRVQATHGGGGRDFGDGKKFGVVRRVSSVAVMGRKEAREGITTAP